MDRANFAASDVQSLLSLLVIGAGIAWALQLLNFGMMWVVGEATLVGAGAGLICAVVALRGSQPALQTIAARETY